MLGLVILLTVGFVLFHAAVIWLTVRSLLRPPRRTYAWAVARGRPGDPSELDTPRAFQSWTFQSGGRAFPVWDIAGEAPNGPVIVCSHGWADSRLGLMGRLDSLASVASRVIAWDLPGHGEAPGICRLGTSEVDDLLALVAHLDQPRRVVLFGWSLGAGMSIAAAARGAPVAGVIAEAPYRLAITPARAVIRAMRMPYRLSLVPAFWIIGTVIGVGPRWNRRQGGMGFDRAALAARLTCPLLILQGERDEVCPIQDGEAIAAAAGEHGHLARLANIGHNDVWAPDQAAATATHVRRFVESLELPAIALRRQG